MRYVSLNIEKHLFSSGILFEDIRVSCHDVLGLHDVLGALTADLLVNLFLDVVENIIGEDYVLFRVFL